MKSNSKNKISKTLPADHSAEIARVRKIMGQLEGIEKMIVARRYCPQILQQIKAASSALAALKFEILKKHISECVTDSAKSGNYSKMLEQILEIIQSQIKN